MLKNEKFVKLKRIIWVVMLCGLFLGLTLRTDMDVQAAPKFKVTNKQMKKAISGYSVNVTINGMNQRFAVKQSEITKLQVKSKKYSSDKKNVTVKAVAYIDREVAVIKSSVTIKYKLKGKKWKVSNVKFGKGSISKVQLKGEWIGTYVANQGQTKAHFVIDEVTKDGYASGTFYFSATPTNPKVPSGSYTVNGGYDKKTGKVTFVGEEWIEKPDTYIIIDFYGYLDLKNKKIKSNTYSLDISKR